MASTALNYCLLDNLAYRADSRDPEIIFREGFWNKQCVDFRWSEMLQTRDEVKGVAIKFGKSHGDIDKLLPKIIYPPLRTTESKHRITFKDNPDAFLDIEIRDKKTRGPMTGGALRGLLYNHYAENKAQYRDNAFAAETKKPAQFDISPETAVCLSLRPDVTPYFPLDGTPEGGTRGEFVWIYVVRLYAGIPTFTLQRKDRPEIAFAKEVAVEHVPFTHVLCAVKCWRIGKYPDMQFNLATRIWWNPYASNFERARAMNPILNVLTPFQNYRTQCPTSARPSRHCLRVRETMFDGEPATKTHRDDLDP